MKNLIILSISIILSLTSYSQGDDCSSATILGTLPTPAGCAGSNDGEGTDVVNALTNIGAIAENPYSTIVDCNGGTADMASPAADVWVTFIASAQVLDIGITGGLNGVNIGLYQGAVCGSLTPVHCDISSSGTLIQPIMRWSQGNNIIFK